MEIHEKTSQPTAAGVIRSVKGCPVWCVAEHGTYVGEEDHVHIGPAIHLGDAITAQLCASTDPDTGAVDGPRIIVGSNEWTPMRTRLIGRALIALADAAEQAQP